MTSREKFEAWWEQEKYDDKLNYVTGIMFNRIKANMFSSWEAASREQELTDMAVQLANAESKCRELAAESVTVKECASDVMRHVYRSKTYLDSSRVVDAIQGLQCAIERKAGKAPATDAFLAEVRASARNEGINYAASRLAAAFNHGFVDKPLTEVCDVVRMILDTKEELANSTLPAADGLSGEYAEEFLEDIAAQLRKGAAL